MAGGVSDGQRVNAAVTNPAFLFKTADDYTIGKLGGQNSDVVSGFFFLNAQRYLNNIAQTIGLAYTGNNSAEADSTGRTYGSTSNAVPDNSTYKQGLTLLSNKFAATSVAGGHTHSGANGDGPPVAVETISGIFSGKALLPTGGSELTINFSGAFADANYSVVPGFSNEVDDPESQIFFQAMVTEKTVSGFTVKLNAIADTLNYYLEYQAVKNT